MSLDGLLEAPSAGSTSPEPGAGGTASVALGLEAALRARAPGVHASTEMVRRLALRVCCVLGLSEQDQSLADVAARVRDIGMIALPDAVVLATGPLSPEDWELINSHPVAGSELLDSLAGMDRVAVVVHAHHERWDGEGYPDGRAGEQIPLLARVIGACDAFVAIASDRPYRKGVGVEAALEHMERERGRQLDPAVVGALVTVCGGNMKVQGGRPRPGRGTGGGNPERSSGRSPPGAGLSGAIERLRVLPAFGPAVDRLLAMIADDPQGSKGNVVSAIESDVGLTVAVLRAAQSIAGQGPVANASDAVAELTSAELRGAAEALPRAAFPWQTPLEAFLHQLRVHAQAVARAAERIARELELRNSDDLLTAALLHDVGKLVNAQTKIDLASDARSATPEMRVKRERQRLALDHASVGGLLVARWGLPDALSRTVAGHHSAATGGELATLVRLADMLAHHANGDAVDRRLMLRLAGVCGLPPRALRDVLFDLPHAGGSQRRRAEPSPLSRRETAVLRKLAEGMNYKQIARELGLSTSTLRTYSHNAYTKMNVFDRAQAVLRATEMGWI